VQNYKKLSDLLGSEEGKRYVHQFFHQNPAQIALQYRGKIACDTSVLAYIIKLYQKARNKIPAWVDNHCIVTTKSYAQSTSQIVALYKSTFIQGKKLLVLGGGLGIDEWAFAQTFNQITSIDNDADLNKCVIFNNKRLAINNVQRITQTAEEYLAHLQENFDCIYTDPDRRDNNGIRKKTLQHSTPDILKLYHQLMSCTDKLIIKASPLIDIRQTIKELPHIAEVRVIAQKNEVKEVLFTIQKGFTGNPIIIAANYTINKWQEVVASGNTTTPKKEQDDAAFFYEPNGAIIKAGTSHWYAGNMGVNNIDEGTYYYTSPKLITGFNGRTFKIVQVLNFSKKNVKEYLKKHKITKANIAKRNFRITVDELKKLFLIKDGGEEYLFFAQKQGKPVVFHCVKV